MLSSSFFAVALGLFALTSPSVSASSHSSLNHASSSLSKRAIPFVDPSVSVDFSSTVPSDCKNGPCTEILAMDKTCNADRDCTSKLLCTTDGLNSLVKCNGCVLSLANRTTGVSESLYTNLTSILSSTSSTCSASATTTLKPFSEYSHTASSGSSSSSSINTTAITTGDGLSSEGVGAAGTSSGAGVSVRTGGAWVAAALGAVVAVLVV